LTIFNIFWNYSTNQQRKWPVHKTAHALAMSLG